MFRYILILLISLIFCAELTAAQIPYSGVWSGTIGAAKVQVFFSENEYDSNYYYIKNKSPIRLERSEKNPSEWNENVGHWEPKIIGIWKLKQVSGKNIKGVWVNPETKEELPIELNLVTSLIKDKDGNVDTSAFYAPLTGSLVYRYGTAKLGNIEYKTIRTDSGEAFELPVTIGNVQKLNKYARKWLDGQALDSYDCQLGGGGGWERSLTPQFIIGNLLVIEDNLPSTFCGGAHDTWSHTHIVYDLRQGDFVDTTLWIKDFYSDNEEKTKFRELIESLNSHSEEDNNFFSLDAPYPTKEGLVFFTSHPYAIRAFDEDILVPYKDIAPYLTPAGKKAISSFMPGLTFAPSLTDAVSDGDIAKVRSLIAAGANVNAKDIYDKTALEIAVSQGYTDIARLLISKGANINVKDKNGDTILNRTLKKGPVEIARFLIKQGADVNIPDSEGVAPLTIALSYEDTISLADLIISKGAEIRKKDENGYTFMDMVLFSENIHDDKYKALRALSTNERLDIAQALVSKGADVNDRDIDGNPLLHRAVSKGNIEIIKFLLDNKADINAKDSYYKQTALHVAIEGKKSIDIIKLLIANGADVNTVRNKYPSIPLSIALGHPDHISVMKLLIKNGAEVNPANTSWTPLHIAAGDGLTDAVELLIRNEAKIDIWNNDESTINSTPLHWAVFGKHIDTVRLLIDKGADINALTKNGIEDTALHNAIYCDADDIAQFLIAKGANVDIKDANGDTPLQWAVYKGNMVITELLLKKGADINTRNNHGDTPLHTALKEKHNNILRLLIEKGADMNIRNDKGLTPLQVATLSGNTDAIKLLTGKQDKKK